MKKGKCAKTASQLHASSDFTVPRTFHVSSSDVNTKLFTFCDIACMVYILNTNCSEKNQRQREAGIFKLHPKKETYDATLREQSGLR